jgi:hypothetical protein
VKDLRFGRAVSRFVLLSLATVSFSISNAQEEPIIVLERFRSCKGCAEYELRIFPNGSVVYVGRKAVKIVGQQTTYISTAKVNELVTEFERLDFFSLKHRYVNEMLQDAVVSSLTFRQGNAKKTVTFQDWGGGAPRWLPELSNKIDEAADSRQWTRPR